MEIENITLKKIKDNIKQTDFLIAYDKLLLNEKLSDEELKLLFKLALLFLNFGDENLKKLGYHIILKYSLQFNDYKPLFDVSINLGYIPISKFIEENHLDLEKIENSFFNSFFSSYQDNYKEKNIYLSHGQKKLIKFSNEMESNLVLIAPTSYGKSEIIIDKVFKNIKKTVCIIVPSKALLAQTKRRLLEHRLANKLSRIVTHPEMYKGTEKRFIAVLTQERLLRLLQKNSNLKFDLVLIDEAHNLMKKDNRATLLSQVLLIVYRRNERTLLNFFSPFIADPENLKIPYANYNIEYKRNLESLKIENYFVCNLSDKDSRMYMYDQFFNKFLKINDIYFSNEISILNFYGAKKNIVYLNKPKHIEDFALELSNIKNETKLISEVKNNISDFLHPEYNLLKCIEKGVVYHHGSMPEVVRLYVEETFSLNKNLQFIVTSSTLLEGVNIPAEKIFLLTTKIGRANFSKSEFKNLIGRVCRFRELFGKETGNLRMLMPQIYVIKSKYEWENANPRNFLESKARIDLKMEDEVDNLLLQEDLSKLSNEELEKLHDKIEYLENIEADTIVDADVEYVRSRIAKLCYKNNVVEFDIKLNERFLVNNLSNKKKIIVNDSLSLINLIYEIFIKDIDFLNKKGKDFLDGNRNFKRIEHESAQKFYSRFLDWRCSSASYKEMIGYFISYWKNLPFEKRGHVFVGKTWGEQKRNDSDTKALYINLNLKTESQKINLAIVRIKEEQDFVDYSLMKFIEILNDLGMMDKDFYEKLKYCSSDKKIITLMKNGFSLELAKCIVEDNYSDLITIDTSNDQIKINEAIIQRMEANLENKILIFEIKYHIHY